MNINKNIIGVIAAKKNSNRFNNKNIYLYNGHPLFFHNVKVLIDLGIKPIVVTDSEDIKEYCINNGVDNIIWREQNLAYDDQPIYDILKYVYHSVPQFDIMVNILANAINVTTENIEDAINCLVENDLWEVRSVDNKGKENGCLILSELVFKNRYQISAYVGAVITESKEIHYESEIRES